MGNKFIDSTEKRGAKLVKNKNKFLCMEGVYTDKNGCMLTIGDLVEVKGIKNKIEGEVIEFHSNNIVTVLYENFQNNLLTIEVNAASLIKL